ncbi:MAG: hypothetical protein PHC51_11910 [bacterium]|nr:hypothetical protein [bacterium]
MQFTKFIKKLLARRKRISGDWRQSPFTDLTPVDNADPDGSYAKALSFAFENQNIKNIALTGPYGSGKSSIIKTYEKNSDFEFLNISLASFKEEGKKSVDAALIERSILQQMLYGADANKLPYSRFKRITTPEHPLLTAMFLAAWVVTVFVLYRHRNELFALEFFSLILLVDFAISIPVVIASDIYKATFGISLKKVSLMNAEIETGETSENSILNRHLDEIIYFFRETTYDAVVIEDLDRFGNPEIFVKLREINKLINDNSQNKTGHPIKFLYALKDDMFSHTKNRAKFFDFIIPVVPIINSSNSLDKMQERLRELDVARKTHIEERINGGFLREVSFYIDDLRLIHNIFNEFVIYYDRLMSESLDVTKLLAMMIYKNVYPSDFENLHSGKGAFFQICAKRAELLLNTKRRLSEQLVELRAQIVQSDNEQARDAQELISAYIGHIVMRYGGNNFTSGFLCNGNLIPFSQITTLDQFNPILSERNIHLYAQSQYQGRQSNPTGKSFSQIEEEINPGETFLGRAKNIENKSPKKKMELQKEILRTEREIAELPYQRFSEILKGPDFKFSELMDECKISNSDLLVYLVREGYLDENYHLYISTFHEGRLTKNDREYILTIRNYGVANPTHKIDTPREVCENIREEDFAHEYVLNVTLMDYLLENKNANSGRIKAAMHFISKHFLQSEVFFSAYFAAGKFNGELIKALSSEWPGFAKAAIQSSKGAEYLSHILRYVDADYVSQKMNIENVLTQFISESGELILTSGMQLPDSYDCIKKLNVRFVNLYLLEENLALLRYAYEESLYAINLHNVKFILENSDKLDDENIARGNVLSATGIDATTQETANFTSILASNNSRLKEYIEQNLPDYIKHVFLLLPNNTDESEAVIKWLLNHEALDDELKKQIISRQKYVFETFDELPESLWAHLLQEEKIATTWQNISRYFSHEESDKTVVTNILGRHNVADKLSSSVFSIDDIGEENSKSLSSFILNNDEINDSDYGKLIKRLPYPYHEFPAGISEKKILNLAKVGTVMLTDKSFTFAVNNNQLTAELIGNNFNTFIKEKEKFPITDDVRELLLSSDISREYKVAVCLDVSSSGASGSKQLARLIADLLVSNEIDCSKFDARVLTSAIANARTANDSIKLLLKCLPDWDEAKAMGVLATLPEPFSEISIYGKRPKLDHNEINLELAKLLEVKGFVSSITLEDRMIKINTYKSSDHSE